MNFNNRNNPRIYTSGCSIFGCLIALFLFSIVVQGSFYLLIEYFWLIIILGLVVWAFRKFTGPKNNQTNNTNEQKKNWNRDYENSKNTSYHNIEREFEEIDDEEDS